MWCDISGFISLMTRLILPLYVIWWLYGFFGTHIPRHVGGLISCDEYVVRNVSITERIVCSEVELYPR